MFPLFLLFLLFPCGVAEGGRGQIDVYVKAAYTFANQGNLEVRGR
jgi:hypothetical protein